VKKIAVFVDVQNVYYTVKDTFNCHFNYRALWRQLSDYGEICIANAYAIDKNDSQQQAFQNILKTIGFDVKLKPYIQRSDGSAKGDWDVGIAIDVMDAAVSSSHKIDMIVLLSGDGDFDLLLERVSRNGHIDTLVYGVSDLTAASLIAAADEFKPIDTPLLLI
jgi:uncharacterized LabA/DUF88 family protein